MAEIISTQEIEFPIADAEIRSVWSAIYLGPKEGVTYTVDYDAEPSAEEVEEDREEDQLLVKVVQVDYTVADDEVSA